LARGVNEIGGIEMAFGGAVAAAAAKRRRMMLAEEEEDMARYTQDDLSNDWEFKIVRSESGAFRKPEVLRKLIEEETRAGWVMLEKFDDRRVRFKRPRSARTRDALLPPGVDPYRTRYGAPSAQYALLATIVLGLVAAGLGALVFLMADGIKATVGWTVVGIVPATLILLGIMLIVKLRLR
jgi:hypothetical protein